MFTINGVICHLEMYVLIGELCRTLTEKYFDSPSIGALATASPIVGSHGGLEPCLQARDGLHSAAYCRANIQTQTTAQTDQRSIWSVKFTYWDEAGAPRENPKPGKLAKSAGTSLLCGDSFNAANQVTTASPCCPYFAQGPQIPSHKSDLH